MKFTGLILILASAFATSLGQLSWKLGQNSVLVLGLGFFLYALGALLMIAAFRHGDVSNLHPILSVSYVISLVLGRIILSESYSVGRILGVCLITIGVFLLARNSVKAAV